MNSSNFELLMKLLEDHSLFEVSVTATFATFILIDLWNIETKLDKLIALIEQEKGKK